MDKQAVFAHLNKQKKDVLLDYLSEAFDEMDAKQQRAVFGDAVRPPAKKAVNGGRLRKEIEQFHKDSLAGKYYAPFNVNSKNYMDVPEETEEWCDRFAGFVAEASKLTVAGEHAPAVACFALLHELLEALNSGQEIIFAEEAGSWMIPTDEKAWLKAYKTSRGAVERSE
jgi:hypothetical protein